MSKKLVGLVGSLALAAITSCTPKTECSGCLSGESCIPVAVSVSSPAGCGIGGQICAVCQAGQVCTNGACVASNTGGSSGTGGGSATGGGVGGGEATGGGVGGGSATGGGVGGGSATGGGVGGGSATGGGVGGGSATGGGVGGGSATGGGVGGGATGGGVGGGSTGGGVGGGATGGGVGGGATGGGVGGGATGGGVGGGATGGGVGGGSGSCTSGFSLCNNTCVDVRIDAANCNGCGRACSGGQSCQAGVCTSASQSALVFSEINPGRNFIEVFNGGSAAVNMLNYSLQWTLGDGGTGSTALPAYVVGPQSFALFGVSPPDAGGVPDSGYLGVNVPIRTTDLALRLISPSGTGVDFVRTGSSMVPAPTGTTWTGMNPPNATISTRQSLVRNLFSADTNTSADWTVVPNASPLAVCARPSLCGTTCIDIENDRANCGACGNACTNTQVCRTGTCVAGGGRLLISEYRIDPVPMIELYNPGSSPVPLSGYRVQAASTGTFLYTFGLRSLAPGKFVTVYAAAGVDDETSVYSGAAPAAGAFLDNSAVTLFDGTMGVDFVRFGNSTTTPPMGVTWFGAGPTYPPISSADLSMHRKIDVIDTDDALNWVAYNPSTPGFACQPGLTLCNGVCVNLKSSTGNCGACGNTCTAPQACLAGSCSGVGKVVISRLSNVSPERIEIYNGGATTLSLDAYAVEWVSESGTDSYSLPMAITLAPGAFLSLIEGSGTSTSSVLYMSKSIVWSAQLAVTLKNSAGMPLDFVRTGTSTVLAPNGTAWLGTTNAPNPADVGSEAVERNVLVPDTDSAADWRLVGAPTFGSLCGPNQTSCNNTCVSLASSAQNCGACGNVCAFSCTLSRCGKGQGVVDNGVVRLVGGNGVNSGLVQAFNPSTGLWAAVCDDYFTDMSNTLGAANAGPLVLCRELGFNSVTSFAASQSGISTFTLDDVQCTGNESSIFNCSHLMLGSNNCGSTENAFVQCGD